MASIFSWFSSSSSQPTTPPTNGSDSPTKVEEVEKKEAVANGHGQADDPDMTPRPSLAQDEDDADAELTMFPAPDSAQRVASSTALPVPAMPTVTPPSPTSPAQSGPGAMGPPPVPDRIVPERQLPPPTLKSLVKAKKKQLKHALAPGHSQMDWAALKTKGLNLRGTDTLLRVTPSQLAQHNTKEDAWSVFFGKVYNITPYMTYHPGGEKRLMKVAGRDGSKLFVHSHEWVNVETMMDECFVGFLVPEPRD